MARPIDYDDDDYFPPTPGDTKPRKSSGLLIAGLVLGAFIIVGTGMYLVRANRQAAMDLRQRVQATENGQAMRPAMQPPPRPALLQERPLSNWEKAIGTWQRQPTGPDDTTYPYRFAFYGTLTAQVTQLHPDGSTEARNFTVEILNDAGDHLGIRFNDRGETMSREFILARDGTLVLRNVGLVFSRP